MLGLLLAAACFGYWWPLVVAGPPLTVYIGVLFVRDFRTERQEGIEAYYAVRPEGGEPG